MTDFDSPAFDRFGSSDPPDGFTSRDFPAEGEPLDALLHSWASETEPDDGQLDRLARRISAALDGPHSMLPVVGLTRSREPRCAEDVRPRAALATGTAVAALLMTIALSVLVEWRPDRHEPPNVAATGGTGSVLPPESAWLADDRASAHRALLSELEALFGPRLAWHVETRDGLQFGLTSPAPVGASGEPLARSSSSERLIVRLVVERRPVADRDGNWRVAWAADVVTRGEEVVQWQPRPDDATAFWLWTFVLPDGQVAVETDLTLTVPATPVALHVAASGIHETAQPQLVFTAQDDGTVWRAFQTVRRLDHQPLDDGVNRS